MKPALVLCLTLLCLVHPCRAQLPSVRVSEAIPRDAKAEAEKKEPKSAAVEKAATEKVPAEKAVPIPAVPQKGAKVEVKPAEKPAADRPRVIVVLPRPEEVNARALQYEQMFSPLMWRELNFVRQCCDLTPDQRPKVKAAAEACVKDVAMDFAFNRVTPGQGDIGAYIRKEVVSSLQKILTEQQLAEYQVEANLRTEEIKRVTVRSTVAMLDGFLYLTVQQRDKISETLLEHWNENWEQWVRISRLGGEYFPQIPGAHLLPHLTTQQKKIWEGAPKINPGFWSVEQQARDDTWWNGEEIETPQKVAGDADAETADEGKP